MRITANGNVSHAELVESDAARDFTSLLPITLHASDLIGREKYSRLPRTLARAPATPEPLEVGDIILLSPGSDVVIFYSHEGQTIPSPGSVVLAKWNGASDALDGSDAVQLTIDRDPAHSGATTMIWSREDLEKIVKADDLHIAPFRGDGVTYGTPTWIWCVAVDGALYVRAYNGKNSSWYQAAAKQKAGRIIAAGMTKEVAFELVDGAVNDRIDDAYRAKYRGSQYLTPMISSRSRAATVRIMPR